MVYAPRAGSGKTTLLAEWRATHGVRAAWIALEGTRRRCLPLLRGAGGLARCGNPGSRASRHSSCQWPPWVDQDVYVSLAARRALQCGCLLDRDRRLSYPDTRRGSRRRGLPARPSSRYRLVVSTRTEPLFPLARRSARGDLVEVRGSDLPGSLWKKPGSCSTGSGSWGSLIGRWRHLQPGAEVWSSRLLHLAALSLRGSKDPVRLHREVRRHEPPRPRLPRRRGLRSADRLP